MFGTCIYDRGWGGMCTNRTDDEFCSTHKGMKCCSCKAQATHDCDYCGQFVCGYPLCDNCEGWHDGTPSTWGFIGHHHRKKR